MTAPACVCGDIDPSDRDRLHKLVGTWEDQARWYEAEAERRDRDWPRVTQQPLRATARALRECAEALYVTIGAVEGRSRD